MKPLFVKAGDHLIPLDKITRVDVTHLDDDHVVVHYDGMSIDAYGLDAIEIVYVVKASVLEGRAPRRWKRGAWAFHNIVGHPVMQVLAWCGWGRLGMRFHDYTTPRPRELK